LCFFQAEDGIREFHVTGVQTCALPISATVLTAAGLTCTHHAHLPLYGGGWGESMACGLMIGAAAFTGYGRLQSGKHYPSDLVLGLGLGTLAGWVMPRALHYGFAGSTRRQQKVERAQHRTNSVAVVGLYPVFDADRVQMSAVGVF